jgi:hypothetical protein
MKIYFAHPINTYNTDIEKQCLDLIKNNLGDKILNPSVEFIQRQLEDYKKNNPDNYMIFFDDLLSECDAIAYLPFEDGLIGAGVWHECKTINNYGGKTYEIDLENETLNEVDFGYIDSKKLSIEETRVRIKAKY